MTGINGETRVPYSFKFELSLVCCLCIMFAPSDVAGHTIMPSTSKSVSAYFDDISSRNIEAIEGQTVIIPCTVRNLSHEKVVSWIRRRDIHILTSGPHTFASDYRFEVVHGSFSEDFWGLRIRGVKPDDTGQYECQVNTEPKLSLAYKLTVSAMGSDSTSKWLGYSKILGPKELFVQNGSPFLLRCEISPTLSKNFSLEVWWLHEDTQIIAQTKELRIMVKTAYDEKRNVIESNLSFKYVTWQDGGTYTCLQPSVKKDSIKLFIVEVESSEAMQRDYPLSSESSSKFILPFNLLIVISFRMYLL